MNLKSRLDRLKERAAPQGTCLHLPPLVAFPAEGAEAGERLKARDTRVCWCGRDRLRIRVVYTEDERPAAAGEAGEVIRLRWPEDEAQGA